MPMDMGVETPAWTTSIRVDGGQGALIEVTQSWPEWWSP
ncbi:hypothetical protein SynRCC2555_00488 [Synechococcus sp. WH 8101]|nr:hypothetical protein SynRCC2555_00488 [Synechococcus sp. WH 8101]